ncbi:DNA glycosylase AlkZ-like family protein [Pediococcus argentinicus]|uniref:Winged helix DNA-binding domain-containing protein n=1 Tax=Pediococcus argentinicus TaxID=480391 RepID=A0A0R2NCC4_9LACO|nr:crosslink repair DNA glycosylase YcaQ family protein [Pediococcus argentinicus]KRO22466.1 hypothetical protein IV88_GL001148 [Pediococcus argentinicus]NKZ23050.1 winged helix DNA-binding domain-containing protein [Pediococcus argentinicus]GEP20144.1 hypothetical protein LSA03_15280 [Pediococcus argentinicus]
MNNEELRLNRLANHQIFNKQDSEFSVLKNSVGIQSQAQRMAEINLAIKSKQLDLSTLSKDYDQQKIVRSWSQRWTLHLLTVEDWNLIINAHSQEHLPNNYYLGEKELVLKAEKELTPYLDQQRTLSKPELVKFLSSMMTEQQLGTNLIYAILQTLTANGHGFFNPNSTTQQFQLVSAQNIYQPMSIESAVQQLIVEYLNGYAPASLEDFVKWTGIKVGIVRPIWKQVTSGMEHVEINGVINYAPHFLTKLELQDIDNDAHDNVQIAARFDALMTGYIQKEWLIPTEYQSIMWSKNGILMAPVLVDGVVIGHWTYKVSGKKVNFEVITWKKISKAKQKLIQDKLSEVALFLEKVPNNIQFQQL